MFTTEAKNELLSALAVDEISLHVAYPGLTGANEVTGGSYARQSVTVPAASGGTRTIPTLTWSVPACTVRWLVGWGGGVVKCLAPNGAVPQEFMADPDADAFVCPAHGLLDGDAVVFYGATPPAPLAAGVGYYVVNGTVNTFQVAATVGGTAIDITGYGSGGCQVSKIYEDTYASPDTHTLTGGTIAAPF